jgi:hypothetical protein
MNTKQEKISLGMTKLIKKQRIAVPMGQIFT